MSKFSCVCAVAALVVVCAEASMAQASPQGSASAVAYASVDRATFQKVEGAPQISSAAAWGSEQQPPFGVFVKFEPGYDAGMHTHTNTVTLIVLKGAYLYRDENGSKRVGPGEVIRIPGGHKHWSGGDAKEGATFYQHMDAAMDMVPAK